MRIYILRHAKAERDSPTGRDEDRPLAPTGIAQARFLGQELASAELKPDHILTSPAERAARTADIIAAAVGVQPRSEARLAPNSPFNEVTAVLRGLASADAPSMIVGHNPVFEELVLGLTSGQPEAPGGLRTGELVVLDINPAGRTLQARFLRSLRLGELEG